MLILNFIFLCNQAPYQSPHVLTEIDGNYKFSGAKTSSSLHKSVC